MAKQDRSGENLLELEDVSEKSIVRTIEGRIKNNRIYTKLGDLLISLNPNEKLPIYDSRVVEMYKTENTNEVHIFTTAEQAYLGLRESSTSQNIIFSGESGSGKTHNSFAALRYLTAISTSTRNKISPSVIDALQIVLTSFAGAKTMKNDNSTRFGYIVELMYRSSSLEGLTIKSALPLDLSRLAGRTSGERNFNVLHELFAGLPETERSQLRIKPDHKFFYLAKDTIDHERDSKNFDKLNSALETLGFTQDQKQFIFTILAAVLHTGNLYFAKKKSTTPGSDAIEVANDTEAKWIASLLGINHSAFIPLFVEKKVVSEQGTSIHSYSMDKALDTRDSFASILYEELFNWMISRITFFFKCTNCTATINVVDMYGVERYNQNNGLEQLLVNTANEYVEQFILSEIFQKETETYTKEHIKCAIEDQKIPNNARTIEILSKRPYGVLPLLDDECKFPKASDDSYLQRCNLNHLENGIFGKARNKDKPEFSIQHFHGVTWYAVNNFLSGNRRSVSRGFLELLCESSNVFVTTVFRALFMSRSKEEFSQMSSANMIKSSQALIERLKGSHCHFVRCIRSNSDKTSGKFDEHTVTRQLRSYSIPETLKFRTSGYPIKIPFENFVSKYRCLLPCVITSCQKQSEILTDILDGQGSLYQNDFQIGTHHVFLRERLAVRLNKQRKNVIAMSAVIVQKTMKAIVLRRKFLRKRAAAIKIQAACRGWIARRNLLRKKEDVFKTLENETRSTDTLRTYRRVNADDAQGKKKEVTKSVLGPTRYLAEDDHHVRMDEELETKKVHYYLTIPADMQRPTIEAVPIEIFAEKHFKGHILEVRREPIQTPFLPKDSEMEFAMALEMFKLVLKYTNDAVMSKSDRFDLARKIVQLAIDNVPMRDELFVQLCNQTYQNDNKTCSDRSWTLLLMAVYSFPPSIVVLPLLLHYFVMQSPPLRTQLMEGLVRKIRSLDAQACRVFASDRLEHASMVASACPVVNVHLPDQDEYPVEAHPWVTAEELALRVLRERGMGDPEGWSVVVETDTDIFCPTQGQFVHDAIAAIESRQKTRVMDEEVDAFFHFPNVRSLPSTAGKPVMNELPRKVFSPVEDREKRIQTLSRQNSFKDPVAEPCIATITINDPPRPSSGDRQSSDNEYVVVRSEEEEVSISLKSDSSSDGRRSSDSDQRDQKPISNEVVADPRNPESDYCYTIPDKNFAARRYMAEENYAQQQYMTSAHQYEVSENHLYTLSPPPPPVATIPIGQATLDRYHSQQAAYAAMSSQMPPQQVQYIQYVPVVVSQPMMPSIYSQATNGLPPGATLAPGQFAHSYMPGTVPAQQLYQPILNPSMGQMMPQFVQQPQLQQQQHVSLAPQLSTSSLLFGTEADERIRAALIRPQPSGVETPVMSVASRIRRMPVPSKNSDVDRFLDEVFQQVLPADIGGMDSISSQRLADSIKGGKKKVAPEPTQQQIYYEPPIDHPSMNPGSYYSLPPMANSRIKLNRMVGSLVRRKSPTKEEIRRHTDELRRKQFSVIPIQYSSQQDIEYPSVHHPSSFEPAIYGDRQQLYDMPPIYKSSSFHPSSQRPPDSGSLMYGETGVASYGVYPPPSRLTVAEEMDIPEPIPAPVPMPRHERPVERDANVVQGDILNSEHLTPGKLLSPARNEARIQMEKEKAALARIEARQKLLPPPIEEVKIVRKKPEPKPAVVIPPVVHIPEEPKDDIRDMQPRTRSPSPERIAVPVIKPRSRLPSHREEKPPKVVKTAMHVTMPAENEWVCEVERPKQSQNMIVEKDNGVSEGYNPPLEIPFVARLPQPLPPQKERAGLHAPKQPWKMTIRKMNFLPGEQLDDVQIIDQVFAQIIDDCRRANGYRIRAIERDNVTSILKKHQIHPDQLNRQYEIPTEVKIDVISSARNWPLYFNQIFEVIEERATENVFILLAVGESGLRLLIHNPENTQSPLTVQDHFEYGDVKDVMLEERQLLTIRTRSNMLVHLRTDQATQIRALIEKYLYGSAKVRNFVLATSDYVTHESDHLSFSKGQRIELVEKNGVARGWMYGRIHNRYGIFPSEHVISEHMDERGNHPDVPAIVSRISIYEDRDEAYGYEYAEDRDGREKYTMLEFALLYFRPPRGEKRKDWSWKEVAKKIMWTERPIQHSLLRVEGAEMNKLACDIFHCIMKFMGDEQLRKGETYTDIVYRIFMTLKRLEVMRDETYCQIVRQTTNNRSTVSESAMRGWRLFSILTSFFDCSVVLKPYLMKHLNDVANDPRRPFHGTAEQCIQNLVKTFKYGGRKFLLSGNEIGELSKGKSVKRQVYHIPGGHKKVVNTSAVTVVEDVVKELCSELNIRSPSEQQEFVLCAVIDNVRNDVIYASNDEYVLDMCTELEHDKNTKYEFHLKRAVWLHPLRLDSALYIDCMYYQILPDYQTGLLVSPQNNGHFSAATLDEIARLAAYVYLADEQHRQHVIDERMVIQLLPQTALLSRIVTTDMWIERVERKLGSMDTNISLAHARAAFLEIVEKWPTFGAIFYRVLSSSERDREISESVISINRSGLRLLSGDNYRTLAEYTLSSIGAVNKFNRGDTEFLEVTIRGAERDMRLTIQSDKARDIARLIGHYQFVYNANKKTIATDPQRIL